jgi:hypothetical protein
MKNKETIEEAAEKYLLNYFGNSNNTLNHQQVYRGFQQGAKSYAARDYWFKEFQQDKNKYSEEEVLVKLYECLGHFAYQHNIVINGNEIDKWFEQFKKK